jgi:hypothetical protein
LPDIVIKPLPQPRPSPPRVKPNITDFFDFLQGNQFTHSNRIFDWQLTGGPKDPISKWFGSELSLDYFGGLLMGNMPFHSPEVYYADVNQV